MRLTIFFISLFIVYNSSGQSLTEIKQLLRDKNFLLIKSYIDTASTNYSKSKSKTKVVWQQLRDITPEYQEGWFYVFDRSQEKNKYGIYIENFFLISFLASEKEIIYYQIRQRKEKKQETALREEYPVIDSFKNEIAFTQLQKSFQQTYNTAVNENELLKSNVYGVSCGYGGDEPEKRIELDSIIERKDINAINNWLKSANSEKQVYAVEALYQLKAGGYALTAEQDRLIKIIKNKKGNISTCSGCIYSAQTIQSILTNFPL